MRRTRTLAFLSVAAWLAILTGGVDRARADVPPPDLCTSPGQPCQNAGAQHNQAGTCMATTCTRTVPNGDGGTTTMSYDCSLCRMPDGGTTGGGGSSSSCAVGSGATADVSGACLGTIALLGLAAGRRRRTSR